MSLNDSHGNIIEAIEIAYNNRKGLDINGAAAIGLGLDSSGVLDQEKMTKRYLYTVSMKFMRILYLMQKVKL